MLNAPLSTMRMPSAPTRRIASSTLRLLAKLTQKLAPASSSSAASGFRGNPKIGIFFIGQSLVGTGGARQVHQVQGFRVVGEQADVAGRRGFSLRPSGGAVRAGGHAPQELRGVGRHAGETERGGFHRSSSFTSTRRAAPFATSIRAKRSVT